MTRVHEVEAGGADPKRAAAERAVELVRSGSVVGLGTGSTAGFAVEALGRRLRSGALHDIRGVPTSRQTRDFAAACGIPLTTLDDAPVVDLTIDGADEVDPSGDLIKGGGGALLWEKIVARASRHLVIVVDASKLVSRLGEAVPLPVEVVRFGWRTHEPAIRELGGEPVLREHARGTPFVSDEGHYILDCTFPGGLADRRGVQQALKRRPGVVETGLFLDMRPEVFVGRTTHR